MARTDEVIDAVRSMILRGDLRPGDRLPVEKDLAARLGVSRGSLREGVRALSAMGVLDTRQGDGTYVTSLQPGLLLAPLGLVTDLGVQDAVHVLAVRRVLEAEAAGLAAQRIGEEALAEATRILDGVEAHLAREEPDHEELLLADRAFHAVVAEAAGNPVLAALLEAFSGRTWRARLWRCAERGALQRTLEEHRAVLAALRRRDGDAARVRMAAHVLGVEEFVRQGVVPGAGPDGFRTAGS